MSTDEMKNIRKDLSLNNTKASAPRICAMEDELPLAFGGVSGSIKLRRPIANDAAAAILKVVDNWSVVRLRTLSIIHPVAIHPMVPSTRIEANSLLGSCICLNATALANASVGA